MMDNNEDIELALYDKTDALLMLNKEERKLLKEFVGIGEKLLKTIFYLSMI